MWRLVVLALLIARGALADPLMVTGFETSDLATANADAMEFTETRIGGITDGNFGLSGNAACSGNNNPYSCCTGAGAGKCSHNDKNGGHSSSAWAVRANCASAQAAYYSFPENTYCTGAGTAGRCTTNTTVACAVNGDCPTGDTCNTSADTEPCCTGLQTGNCSSPNPLPSSLLQVAAAFNLRVETAPGAATTRTLFQLIDHGSTPGCNIQVNHDTTLTLFYNTTSLGTTSTTTPGEIVANACLNDLRTPCTVNGDCTSGTCGTCASDGTGCYWAAVEVVETIGSGSVECDLWLNNQQVVTGTTLISGSRVVDDFHIGCPAVESSSVLAYFDDLVLDTSGRAGVGYVVKAVPATDGTVTWQKSAAGNTASGLTNDWGNGSRQFNYANGGYINAKATGLSAQIATMVREDCSCGSNADCNYQGGGTCTSSLCTGCTTPLVVTDPVTAADLVVAGSTASGATTRQLTVSLSNCPTSTTCTQTTKKTLSLLVNTSDHVFARWLQSFTPGGQAWSAVLATMGLNIATTDCTCGSNADCSSGTCSSGHCTSCNTANTFVPAALVYLRASRGQKPPRNLKDHNARVRPCSTDADCGGVSGGCVTGFCEMDGFVTVMSIGDSTDGGTLSSLCNGGTNNGLPCTQKTYCSYDPGTLDQPPAGCNLDNTVCQICTARKTENNGLGYQCTTNGQCPSSGATCTTATGLCSANVNVPCCAGGTCSSGTCSSDSPSGWAGLSCDSSCNSLGGTCLGATTPPASCILSCPGGGCSVTKECQNGTGTNNNGTVCNVNGDCTGGGKCLRRQCSEDVDCRSPICSHCSSTNTETCSGKTCVGGSVAGIPCSANSDCTGGGTCLNNVGTCPNLKVAWGAYITQDMDVDYNLQCGHGAETATEMLSQRFTGLLQGRDFDCISVTGKTGQCVCTTDADCGGGGGSCATSGPNTGTCTSGSGSIPNAAACLSHFDCNAGKACGFPAPDYIATMEAYNTPGNASTPLDCTGFATVIATSLAGAPVCDPGVNTHCANQLCGGDSDCTGTVAADAQCVGLFEANTANACDLGGTAVCSVKRLPCLGSNMCPSGSTCSCPNSTCLATLGDVSFVQGMCDCTSDSDCGTGSGFHCGGPTNNKICRKDCGRCSVTTSTVCAVDGDCPGGETCNSSVDTDCGTPTISGACPTSTPRICKGRCNCPADSLSCTTDADCAEPSITSHGVTHQFGGTCVSGHCTCTGQNTCPSSATCTTQYLNWVIGHSHWLDFNNYNSMITQAAAQGGHPPHLVWTTIPDTMNLTCEGGHGDREYFRKVSMHFLQDTTDYPLVADMRKAMDEVPATMTHADTVHFKKLGAQTSGLPVRDLLKSLNTCTLTATPTTAQQYCLAGASYKTCSVGTDCATAAAGGTCSGGFCICNTSAACPAGNLCVAKPCTTGSDCPATTDSCHAE